jgi:acetyl esterase/lipase
MAGSLEEFVARPVVYTVPGMDRVEVRTDLAYRTPADEECRADVYLPEGLEPTERRPAVLFVHGDGPPEILRNAKDWGSFVSWGRMVAASGLVGVTFNHSSSEDRTRLAEAAGDVDALTAFVLEHSGSLHVHPDRIAVFIFSMGPPVGLRSPLRDRPDYLRCIVSYYGVMDLEPLRSQTANDVSTEVLREFSPIHQLRTGTGPIPPVLLAERGAEVDLLNHPGRHHAFDILDDDERSRDIIGRTLQFLRRHLLGVQRA